MQRLADPEGERPVQPQAEGVRGARLIDRDAQEVGVLDRHAVEASTFTVPLASSTASS